MVSDREQLSNSPMCVTIIMENHIYSSLRRFSCGGFNFALQKFNDTPKLIPKDIE